PARGRRRARPRAGSAGARREPRALAPPARPPSPSPRARRRPALRAPLPALSLTPQVTVHYLDAQAGLLQPFGDLLGDRHAAVLAARAADRERHVLLPLALVAGQGEPQRRTAAAEEGR